MLAIGSGECMGGSSMLRFHHLITIAQTVAPNDITSTRWQHPYPGYFGFIFVQWEEAETRRHPYTVYVLITLGVQFLVCIIAGYSLQK